MSGPSITSWNRLEPRPRANSLDRSLAAQVRDPLWFLTRQWQFGELQGEDAGSPSWVEVRSQTVAISGWSAPGTESRDYALGSAPLDRPLKSEPFTPDEATAVELAQRFETLLDRHHRQAFGAGPAVLPLPALIQLFRAAYPLGQGLKPPRDRELLRFRRLCASRSFNGCALYEATRHLDLPALPVIEDPDLREVVRDTLSAWRIWCDAVLGDLGTTDAACWNPERLAYAANVVSGSPVNPAVRLEVYPGRGGQLDWYAFDSLPLDAESAPWPDSRVQGLLPTNLRFSGMPHARWWQMQDRLADFGEIQPDLTEIAKIVLMDFMFVQGNDWFVVPYSQAVGTLNRIDRLQVHDVFGGRTLVERANRQDPAAAASGQGWSMFGLSAPAATEGAADYFLLAPCAAANQNSAPLETVAFIRDEAANLAWALEQTTENGVGIPWLGRERSRNEAGVTPPASPDGGLRYRIQTDVPRHWIPFAPVRVDHDPTSGEAALAMAVLPQYPAVGIGPPQLSLPRGRILPPYQQLRLREEEVTRAGVSVSRIARRARWIDGSTQLWLERIRTAGRGEGSSGLRFDVLVSHSEGYGIGE